MTLAADNYYSEEANRQYMSVSQYKDFVGSTGIKGCEAMAMAEIPSPLQSPKSRNIYKTGKLKS